MTEREKETNEVKKFIEQFIENLNQKEKTEEPPIIGRETEIKQLVYILSRAIKNNPLLIGYPGVGKTAIIKGLVEKIRQKQVPDYLKNKVIYKLNIISLRAGTKFQGEIEKRLKIIFDYMSQPKNNAILFIDEVHLIIREQGGTDISNLLKSALSQRKGFRCIGITTFEEYRRYVEKDEAFARRFSNLIIHEPSAADSISILQGIKNYLENYYELKISNKSLAAATKLSQRYLTNSYLPDKAIDLLDETCGRIKSEA